MKLQIYCFQIFLCIVKCNNINLIDVFYLKSQFWFYSFSRGSPRGISVHTGVGLILKSFIDSSAHLSNKPVPQCQFRFEQKSYYLRGGESRAERGDSIVFGTEVLIRHVFSNYYLSIELGEDGNQIIRLRPDCNQFCYFELLPQRTFEHKGDFVNFESFFVIKHSIYKCYLGSNILQNGSVRARMERQIKTSKVKQSHRINLVKGLGDYNQLGHQEDLREIIESQWDIREELKDQLRRNEQKHRYLEEPPVLARSEGDSEKQLKGESEEVEPILLPLKRGVCKPIRDCSIEKHIHTMWRARRVEKAVHPFLQDNDYIYFISSSKSRGLMNITCRRGREESELPQIEFIKNQGENQYICSAIFSVEVHDREYFSLKHVLSGRYFPFTSDNSKKLLKLKPLLPFNSLENKLPPFHLLYQERFYPTSIEEDATTCGFWLNKVNKLELNQILSLEGVSHAEWIKYLLGYLDSNRKRRQEILQQFRLLQFVIERLIHPQQRSPQVFKLLFKMISGKQSCLRQATSYLNSNILLADKGLIIDILSELFDNEFGYVQKFINPQQVGYILRDFLLEESFSVNYMRIFRLFCGHHSQPCQRNQNLIYSFFFHKAQRTLTHSAVMLQQQLTIPPRYKFKIRKQKDLIVFETEGIEKQFSEFDRSIQQYIRQYYYLLGDCLRLNKSNSQSFRKDLGEIYSLDLLLDILERSDLAILRGPITHLLNCGYLEPEYRFKLYVFVPHYESMCYNGSLIALHRSDKITRLLGYICSQIDEIRKTCDRLEQLHEVLAKGQSKEVRLELAETEEKVQFQFKSTQFRHLLLMVKFSIENAYWESESSVVALVEAIGRFYKSKKTLLGDSLSSYNQISERKNYLDSTVLCLDIATLLLDLQVNLALSHLLSLPQEKIGDSDIEASAKRIQGLQLIRCSFGKFKLSEHEDSRLVKRSLGLVRKFYQLRDIIHEHYFRAMSQRKRAGDMSVQIELIKSTLYSLRLSNQMAINSCKRYIAQCLPTVELDDLQMAQILGKSYNLSSFGTSCQPCIQFQTLAYRLGVLQALRQDLWRYANLRGKEKGQQEGCVYWKMLLLLALIKANPELRRIVSGWRKWLVGLVGEEEMREGGVSLLVLEVLTEIYRDWRGLIVADSEHVLLLCEQFVRLVGKDNTSHLGSNAFLNTKLNKILSLLLVFLQVEGRQVRNHFPTVLNEIFDKESLIQCIIKLRNIDNLQALHIGGERPSHSVSPSQLHNNILFKLLLHLLAKTLDQKPQRIGFTLPEASRLLNLILAVGRQNCELIFQIYRCLTAQTVAGNQQLLLSVLKANLNEALELIASKIRAEKGSSIANNIEINTFLSNFPVLVKVSGIILQSLVDEGKKNVLNEKTAVIEKLFLLSRFTHSSIRQKLIQLCLNNRILLQKSEQQIARFQGLRLQNFKIEEIKKFQGKLINIATAEESLQKQQNAFSMDSFFAIFGQSWSKGQFSRTHPELGGGFQIGEVQEFIHSLIFMNKSEGFSSETDLKTFFLSFLSNTFPAIGPEYGEKLKVHQEKLLSYGAAELITTILQEKYREGGGLFLSLFQLGNKLLQSGSVPAQAEFLEIFKRDHKNRIFENITTVIERSLLSLRFYYQQEGEGGIRGWETAPGERQEACEMLRKVFRFLQLLCENDNQEMKKYVFSQTNEQGVVKYMSVNFIQLAIHLVLQISVFTEKQLKQSAPAQEIGANLLETIIFIMDFLIEVCQYPAIKNQMYLCNTDFFNLLTLLPNFASLRPTDRQLSSVIFRIERKVVLLLRGLLEERNSDIILMVSKKMEYSHIKYLIQSSLNAIGVASRQELLSYLQAKEEELIEEVENVVDLLIISRVLGIRVVQRFGVGVQGVLEEVDKKIREIEVDFKGQLTKMYFCYRPSFDLLSENTRSFFISKSSLLESRNEKLRELLNSRAIINQDILNSKSRQIFISERTITYLFVFSLLLCFLLVLMQLFFYSINPAGMALDPLEHSLIHAASLMQLLLSLIYIMLWGANISSLTKEKLRSRYRAEATTKMSAVKYYCLLAKEIYLEEGSSLHATLLLGLSVGGCLIDTRLYSFVFLYSFAKIETLSSILQAIRLTLGKLAVVCLFALTFAFVFGFLSIDNYITVLYDNESVDVDIGQISSHCSSIVGCIDSLYTQRIIGETPSREGETSHYGRFFSDTVHWSFFDILFTNIIAAIIIDKFAELRNIKERIENEQRNRCFICSAEKASVERKDEDFDQHISRKHYLWDYFFYLYYLEKLKSHTEYTGIEYWIVRQVKENKIDWFPSDEALKEDDDEKKINSLFEAFVQRMQRRAEGEKSTQKKN